MNRQNLAVIVVLLTMLAVCTTLTAGYVNSHDPTAHEQGPSLFIKDLSLTNNTKSLNGSFTLLNTYGLDIEINKFSINDIALENVSGLTVYVNGTSINYLSSSLFILKQGDTLNVNLIIPYENNSELLDTLKNNHFELKVWTPEALYGRELN